LSKLIAQPDLLIWTLLKKEVKISFFSSRCHCPLEERAKKKKKKNTRVWPIQTLTHTMWSCLYSPGLGLQVSLLYYHYLIMIRLRFMRKLSLQTLYYPVTNSNPVHKINFKNGISMTPAYSFIILKIKNYSFIDNDLHGKIV